MRGFREATVAAVIAAAGGCSAAADRQPPSPPPPAPAPAHAPLDARLTAGDRPAPLASGRNPFRFGAAAASQSRGAQAPLPPPEGLPELPLPIVSPPLKLLGIATLADGARVAMLRVGADLVLAREGEVVAGRYRVNSVAENAVDLTDAVGDQPVRLDLP